MASERVNSSARHTESVTREISQRELREDCDAILLAVEAGADFVVTRDGRGVAELRPQRRRRFTPRSELLEASRHVAPMDADAFRADVDEVLDQGPEGCA